MAEEPKSEIKTMKTRRVTDQEIDRLRDYFHQLEELLEQYEDSDDDIGDRLVDHVRAVPRYDVVLFNLTTLLDNCADKEQKSLEFAPWIDKLGKDNEQLLKHLELALYALNEIPRTPIRHEQFKDSYQVASVISKYINELKKADETSG